MGATLDGRVQGIVMRSSRPSLCCRGRSSEEAAAENICRELQHNMWVVAARTAVLSVITGGGKWVEILAHADPLYQHLIVTAERKFWRCVDEWRTVPQVFGVEPPKPRLEAVRVVGHDFVIMRASEPPIKYRRSPAFLTFARIA